MEKGDEADKMRGGKTTIQMEGGCSKSSVAPLRPCKALDRLT